MNLPDLATKLAEKEYLTQRDAETAVILIFRLFSDAMWHSRDQGFDPLSSTRKYEELHLVGCNSFFPDTLLIPRPPFFPLTIHRHPNTLA